MQKTEREDGTRHAAKILLRYGCACLARTLAAGMKSHYSQREYGEWTEVKLSL
jgi:hypothetical protein